MDCKKCGAQLVDDAIFCSQCGARVDGKIACKNCGREIAEDSVFCPYCGKRLDGKRTCDNCGTAFAGNFCPKCGKPYGAKAVQAKPTRSNAQQKVAKPVVREEKKSDSSGKNVLNIVKQSLLYGALCIMFICCFFVSMNVIVEAGREQFSESSGATSFYFLIDIFKEVKADLADGGVLGKEYFIEYEVSQWLLAGFMALCVAVIMVISITFFIIGTVKYVKAMMNKQRINMSKYVVVPAIINLASLVFLRALMSMETGGSSDGMEVSLAFGAVPILEVVFVAVLLCGAGVLHLISEKINGKRILNLSFNAGGIIFAFVLLETLTASATKTGSDDAFVGLNAGGAFFGVLAGIGMTPSEQLEMFGNSLVLSMLLFIFYTACFVLAATLMCKFAKNILNNNTSFAGTCIISGVTVGVAIAYLVIACILRGETVFAGIGASPICAVIFSIFVLAVAIVAAVLLREKPIELYDSEDYAYEPYQQEQTIAESVATEPVVETIPDENASEQG